MSLIYIGVVIILILLYFASIEKFDTQDNEESLRNRIAELQRQEQELEQLEVNFQEEKSKAEKLRNIREKEAACYQLFNKNMFHSGEVFKFLLYTTTAVVSPQSSMLTVPLAGISFMNMFSPKNKNDVISLSRICHKL